MHARVSAFGHVFPCDTWSGTNTALHPVSRIETAFLFGDASARDVAT
jgi:hypothetical protein